MAPTASYATTARRDAYVTAMHSRIRRRTGPVVVYLSAPARRQAHPTWPRTLRQITTDLPDGVILDTFPDAFPGGPAQYRLHWLGYAADLDGLIVFGTRTNTHTYLLGPGTRQELRTIAAAGLPVLLHTDDHGLIPLVDCHPHRRPDNLCLELAVPPAWTPDQPTLRAALHALSARAPHIHPQHR